MGDISPELLAPDQWLQWGAMGVLALYIVLHWFERRDIRKRSEAVMRGLSCLLSEMKVLLDERLPHD